MKDGKTKCFFLSIVLLGLSAACARYLHDCGDEREIGVYLAPVTCDPYLDVYPVNGPHNGGWDSLWNNFTCPPHPPESPDNSDFIPGDHYGNDIFGERGVPIIAARSGTIVRAGYSGISGNRVTIVDDCGWYHFYAHLDSIIVWSGYVEVGTLIGTLGNTGAEDTAPHLHYSLYPDDCYTCGIDPFPYLEAVDYTSCTGPVTAEPLEQINGNEAMALVSWTDGGEWPNDGHPEIFVTTPSGAMIHMYPHGHGDDWSPAETLDAGAACGFAAGFWPAPKNYPEVFTPTPAGSTAHLWLQSGEWTTFEDFGGSGMEQLSTVTWIDGRVEVFALGPDHAIWHNWWMGDDLLWSGWQSLEGSLITGASAISWEDGHVELFATDGPGRAWHNWSGDFPSGWHGWEMLEGEIASRPVPVRWPDGHVELFARGRDGHLQHCWHTGTDWNAFVAESAGTTIEGEPSVAMNPDGAGTPAGPEVVARGADGKVLHLWWTGTGYSSFEPLGGQAAASDPFVWKRTDGTMEVFVIDPEGRLRHIRRDADKNWGAWSTLGEGFDPCVASGPEPEVESEPGPEPEPDAATDAVGDMTVEAEEVEDAPTVEDAAGDGAPEDIGGEDEDGHPIGVSSSCSCLVAT